MCKFCSFIRRLFGVRDDPGNPGFDRTETGQYHAVFENTRQPTPGAMSYAYETLGLVQMAPAGPTVTTREPLKPLHPQIYVGQGVQVRGVPTTAGQVVGQPLFDPGAGYPNDFPVGIAPQARFNVANPMPYRIGQWSPTPDRAKGAP